jgi:phage baseplate assembly protein gpV
MNGAQLVFGKFTQGTAIDLDWGVKLISFSPRLSIAGQLKTVTVKGWDVSNKLPIVGTKNTSTSHPSIGFGKSGGQALTAISLSPQATEVRTRISTQSEAEAVAQGILDKANAAFVEAEGRAFGNAAIVSGAKVKLGKLGTKFNGTYVVSYTRHLYEEGAYVTEFRIEGYQPKMLGDLLQSSPDGRNTWNGVVPAIVTNNADPQFQARVKLKYPWLADDKESGWVRVAMVGAGNGRGLLWVPEVNDEVLVAFEHGDFNRPYVIGSLYNGMDVPPDEVYQQDGNIEVRTLKTRAGHIIRLTDKDGQEKIEVIDAKTKTQLIMDTAAEKITIEAGKDIMIEGKTTSITLKSKDITLDASGKVTIKGAQGIDIESGNSLTMKSTAAMNVESTASLTIKGTTLAMSASATAELKASGMLTLSSSAITEVKGSLVKIN